MVPKRLITKINFGGNGNHTFFVSGDIGLCVNHGTGFLAEKVLALLNVSQATPRKKRFYCGPSS
jgi:hypothetical protein